MGSLMGKQLVDEGLCAPERQCSTGWQVSETSEPLDKTSGCCQRHAGGCGEFSRGTNGTTYESSDSVAHGVPEQQLQHEPIQVAE